MRLSQFIHQHRERILAEWDSFAATMVPAATSMSRVALRDHAQQMLEVICEDLDTAQSRRAQREKARGQTPVEPEAPETAAQTHAVLRGQSGFTINQLAAEYRSLRASVLRLWVDDGNLDAGDIVDVIRFNEAIDQALAESIDFYSAQVDQTRNLFLGMLGHDMRSPLQTILTTAHSLPRMNADSRVAEASARLINSGARMKGLLDDLVDYSRTKLGRGIHIQRTPVDGALAIAAELDLIRGAYPKHQVDLRVEGDVCGHWDEARLRRMVGNLVINAIKYGAPDSPVHVHVDDQGNDVRLVVGNRGSAIDPTMVDRLFEPFWRGVPDDAAPAADSSVGLGLYIAQEIAKAHGGEISVRSDSAETVFAVRLPRLEALDVAQEGPRAT